MERSETMKMRNWKLNKNHIPETSGVYIITYKNTTGLHTDAAIYDSVTSSWFWDEEMEINVPHEIVAWQEPPLPCQPEVEPEN